MTVEFVVENDAIVFGTLGKAPVMFEAVVSVQKSAARHVDLRSPTLPGQGSAIVIVAALLITRGIPFDKEAYQYSALRQG